MTDLLLVKRSDGRNGWFTDAFATLPEKAREGNYRTGLVPGKVWERFLEMAPEGFAEFWVASIGDTPVGRVGASLLPRYPGTGALGFFEVDMRHPARDTVARRLLAEASAWLASKGVTRAVGPMALNTWFPYRFRVDGETAHHFPWEPINPPEYPAFFSAAGFTECQRYHSIGTKGLREYVEKTESAYRAASDKGFTFRAFDGASILEKEIPLLYDISMKGFTNNYLFEPIPLALFRELYVPFANKMDFSYAFFALSPEGKEAGFFFAFPSAEYVVFKSATVLPEYRGLGLSNAMSHLIAKRAVENGMDKYISALVRSGAQSESYGKKGETLWAHEYALFEKPLYNSPVA